MSGAERSTRQRQRTAGDLVAPEDERGPSALDPEMIEEVLDTMEALAASGMTMID